MSDLTYKLERGEISRDLCIQASDRIKQLEQALIDLESYFMVGNDLPEDSSPLEYIMKSLKQT